MYLHHVAVVCRSVENADAFYEKILGLEKKKDTTIPEGLTEKIFGIAEECRLLLYSGPSFTVEAFITRKELKRKSSFEHICLLLKDKHTFIERCRAGGCDINLVPRDDYFLTFIKDFDGNLFEIKEIDSLK